MYEWIERMFVSDIARFQTGDYPPLTGLFDGLSAAQSMALIVSGPRYCPIRCGLSYGAWALFPVLQRQATK